MRFRSSARPHSQREEKLLSLGEKYGKGFLAQNHLNFDKWKKKMLFSWNINYDSIILYLVSKREFCQLRKLNFPQ